METVTLHASLHPAVRLAAVLRPASFPPVPDSYAGAYTVTPTFAEQSLPTAGKIMLADVAVAAISITESVNAGGGLTAVIGGT